MNSIVRNRFDVVKKSPTLRFIVFGALMYVLASVQGSMEALRSVNYTVHFTHYTVAHAHLGLYAFFTMILFGAIYFMVPRLINWEWPSQKLISAHFWLVLIGITIYVVGLTIGGIFQGVEMNDPTKPFIDSVIVTIPYLKMRTLGGVLISAGHIIFTIHLIMMLMKVGVNKQSPTLFEKYNV